MWWGVGDAVRPEDYGITYIHREPKKDNIIYGCRSNEQLCSCTGCWFSREHIISLSLVFDTFTDGALMQYPGQGYFDYWMDLIATDRRQGYKLV